MHQSWVRASANNQSAGVLTLIQKQLPCTILAQHHDAPAGIWSHISIQLGKSILEPWNVYGPNVDNKPFLVLLTTQLCTTSSTAKLLIGREFNAVPCQLEDCSEAQLSFSHAQSIFSCIDFFLSSPSLSGFADRIIS